ncbi:VOC family protein, partial [Mycolicibacterium porcinum]|uniref:VOC family protein n=1 Tax=Mycolicibacterium porcinum TaxID=39693 RepID=UPI0034CFE04E
RDRGGGRATRPGLGAAPPPGPGELATVGHQNRLLAVTDLDATYRAVIEAGFQPVQEPFPIDRVRMFFVNDPDGTAVEFVEFPGGARSSYEMHRGTDTVGGT